MIEQAACQEAPLVSWIPENTGGYFPNPANKYIAIPGLCLEPDRIVWLEERRGLPRFLRWGPHLGTKRRDAALLVDVQQQPTNSVSGGGVSGRSVYPA